MVAVGGDGTVLEVAGALREAGRSRPGSWALGILPMGSGNDAACMAGVGRLDQALAALGSGVRRSFDLIEVECRTENGPVRRDALIFAGAGLAADILRDTTPGMKRWLGGRLGYIAGFFRALWRHRPYPMEVRVDGRPERGGFAAVVAASHTHAGGQTMHIGPGGRPDDGLLEVSLIRSPGRIAVGRQFISLLRGTHVHHPAVQFGPGRHVELAGPEPVPVQADGECLGTTPARFRVVPRAMPIAVPARESRSSSLG